MIPFLNGKDENGVEEEEDSDEGHPGQGGPTPPESPSPGLQGEFEFDGRIIPEIDIYAIPSNPSNVKDISNRFSIEATTIKFHRCTET